MSVTHTVHYRRIICPACSTRFRWVEQRLPLRCPECGSHIHEVLLQNLDLFVPRDVQGAKLSYDRQTDMKIVVGARTGRATRSTPPYTELDLFIIDDPVADRPDSAQERAYRQFLDISATRQQFLDMIARDIEYAKPNTPMPDVIKEKATTLFFKIDPGQAGVAMDQHLTSNEETRKLYEDVAAAACGAVLPESVVRRAPTYEQLCDALDLAIMMLSRNEPGDSRAVSDVFVALAAISCGIVDDATLQVISEATVEFARGEDPRKCTCNQAIDSCPEHGLGPVGREDRGA